MLTENKDGHVNKKICAYIYTPELTEQNSPLT